MYSASLLELTAKRCIASFLDAGRTVSATVRESNDAFDLALVEPHSKAAVVRCVERCTEDDVRALRTMLAQGDFTRAAIVYTAEDQPHFSGEIETYPLSRIHELAASLAEERSAP